MATSSFYNFSGGDPYGFTQVSPLADPGFNELYGATRSMIPQGMDSLQSIIQGGMNSPLLAQIIQGALGRLAPAETASRNAVTDAARAAGSLRSTAYGQSVANNENNILTSRGGLISDMIAKTLGTLVPGVLQEQRNSFMPAQSYMDLLKIISPQTYANRAPYSGSGGSNSGGISDPFGTLGGEDFLSQYRRMGNQPQYGGSGALGVNAGQQGSGSAISGPAPNAPYGGYGLTGGYGTGINESLYGPSAPSYNPPAPEYGPWTSVPATSMPYDSGNIFGQYPAPNQYSMTDWEF